MEHFSFPHQPIIDQYMALNYDIDELYTQYKKSSEGHEILKYNTLFETIRYHNGELISGFIPREHARTAVENQNEALDYAID
jgi:hypothetical protein